MALEMIFIVNLENIFQSFYCLRLGLRVCFRFESLFESLTLSGKNCPVLSLVIQHPWACTFLSLFAPLPENKT